MNIRILSLHGMFADIQFPDFFVHDKSYISCELHTSRHKRNPGCKIRNMYKKDTFFCFIFAHRKQQPFKRNKDETETDFTHLGLQPASDGS